MTTPLYLLRIEIDGHFHGSSEVPQPWCARVAGTCSRYGLQREFIKPLNDWRNAHKAWSGNIYGVTSTFPLRDGNVYEVSRLRGRSSKRHVAREFYRVRGSKRETIDPLDALAHAEGEHSAAATVVLRLREDDQDPAWVAELQSLATQPRLGFVLVGNQRHFLLREGRIYRVHGEAERFSGDFACVRDGKLVKLSEGQALEALMGRLR
jgi:hypothetical protein